MNATLKLDSYMLQLVDHQRRAYVSKFGRDPDFEDPVFFDPEADAPRPLTHGRFVDMMVEAMEQAGVEPGVIYAFRKTGLIVTDALLGELRPKISATGSRRFKSSTPWNCIGWRHNKRGAAAPLPSC